LARGYSAGAIRRGAWPSFSGRAGFWAREDGIAQTESLLFQCIEEAASPDVFRGEDAQANHDGEPTGAWGDDHDQAEGEQGESEENFEEAFSLLQSLDHFCTFFDGEPELRRRNLRS
jgi:hypothetical protein